MNYTQFSKLSTEEQTKAYNSLSLCEKLNLDLQSYKINGVNELGKEEKEFATMIGKSEEDFVRENIATLKDKITRYC